MAGSFKAVSALADFSSAPRAPTPPKSEELPIEKEPPSGDPAIEQKQPLRLGGLVYNIQLLLPESRDQAVYDVLFRSMKQHLF